MHPRYLLSGGLVVWQCFIKIHLNAPHQILQALNQIRADGLEPIGVTGDVLIQQYQERSERRKQTYGNADALPWRAASVESSSRQALAISRSPKPEPSATASTPASSQGNTSAGLRPPAAMQ